MIERFDDQLLNEFVHNFYGYGNYGGAFWFLGMEEGGGVSFTEITKRLDTWARRGKRELEDVADFHNAVGITHLFNDKPKLQPTWNKLIRILLSRDNQAPTTEQVREYQRVSLGRPEGNTCLTELLPLPSPSTDQWLFSQYSALPYLASRDTYIQACLPSRIVRLRKRIIEYKPKVVVFYGLRYQEHWQDIAEVGFLSRSDGVYTGRSDSTLFVITRHPATKGVTSEYFHQIGRLIHSDIGEF